MTHEERLEIVEQALEPAERHGCEFAGVRAGYRHIEDSFLCLIAVGERAELLWDAVHALERVARQVPKEGPS